jgi:hypothetical protein
MRYARSCAPVLLLLTVGLTEPAALDGQDEDVAATVGVLAAGAAVLGVGVFDIATAGGSARRYNERNLALRPLFDPQARRYGLALSFSVGNSIRSSEPRTVEPWPAGGLPQVPRSSKTATFWSLGATLIPSGIGLAMATAGGWNDNHTTLGIGIAGMASGWLFGPSAGHWYAEQHGRAWITTGLRAGLMVLGLLALSTVSFD